MTTKPYKSLFSDKDCTPAQHLAELVCKKLMEKNNSGALPREFWNNPKFKNIYIREVSQASVLLKQYSIIAIINALGSFQAKMITSLRNKNLLPLIKKEQSKIKQSEFIEESSGTVSTPKPFGHNRLEEL